MRKNFLILIGIVLLLGGCVGETTSPKNLASTATAAQFVLQTKNASIENEVLTPEPLDSIQKTPSTATPISNPTSTFVPLPEGAYGYGDLEDTINPLTGLVVENPEMLDRRPVGVKINNYPRSNRPQWGLSLADIVYEFYHNNDLPRFHAIFYTNDASQVGPIRSGRMFDRFIVAMYQTQFLFAKADAHILAYFESLPSAARYGYPLDGECPPNPVCRFEPETVNYLLGDTAEVAEFNAFYGADDERPVLDGMAFHEEPPDGGEELSTLTIRYSYSAYLYWDYRLDEGKYYRFQDLQESIGAYEEEFDLLKDRLTGDAITTENVIVLSMDHFHRFFKPGDETTPLAEIVDMNFFGKGDGLAMRDGMVYPIVWERSINGEMVRLFFDDGTPYLFKPGKTWFEIISTESLIDMSKDSWRIDFVFTRPDEPIYWEAPE